MDELAPALGVYVHWPYCSRICPYCDFNVYRHRGKGDADATLADAILADLVAHQTLTSNHRLTSIYFGGGTPSLMAPLAVERMIKTCRQLWAADNDLEITLEANPTDAEAGRFEAFAAAGVNRLSLGLQSLNDDELRTLGRNHTATSARDAAKLAREVFPALSVDLIYALPGQTIGAWRDALIRTVEGLGPDHISPYQLTIESGTAFERAVQRGRMSIPDEDAGADLFDITQSVLSELGFEAYEISNHARSVNARSRHNLTYWRGEAYVGVGPGAHGRLPTPSGWMATEAVARPGDYVATIERQSFGHHTQIVLSAQQRAEERVIMGLRTVEGVRLSDLAPLRLEPRADVVRELSALGLITVCDDRLMTTSAGRPVLNAITRRLLTTVQSDLGVRGQALVSSSTPRASDAAAW